MNRMLLDSLDIALREERTLSPCLGGWTLYVAEETGSTMQLARDLQLSAGHRTELAELSFRDGGARADFGVLAFSQSAGRGRRDRVWHSKGGAGIYVTYVFFPKQSGEGFQAFSLAMGLAVANSVAQFGADVALKWPNDVIIWTPTGAKKLSGILVDAQSGGAQSGGSGAEVVFVGIGLNLLRQDFPPDVPGISLEEILGSAPDYALSFARLTAEALTTARQYFAAGFAPFASQWNDRSGMVGRKVRVATGGNEFDGAVLEVLEDGALLFQADGEEQPRKLYSAELALER